MKAPFPYFGGKSRVADVVWQRFGSVRNYIEPFCGSAAVLLARPEPWDGYETINDFDGYVANFWRALIHAPEEVSKHANYPVNEIELVARHKHLAQFRDEFGLKMRENIECYDAKVAGWWVYGMCGWIGAGFATLGISPKLPHLSMGRGINRNLPSTYDVGDGIENHALPHLIEVANRIRRVRVACGSWERVLGESVTIRLGITGVFLDPPYPEGDFKYGEGADREVAHDVRDWCIENGDNPLLRIALCGYDEHKDMEKHGWVPYAWKAHGGYSNVGHEGSNANRFKEVIWFSPHCLNPEDPDKFEEFFFGGN